MVRFSASALWGCLKRQWSLLFRRVSGLRRDKKRFFFGEIRRVPRLEGDGSAARRMVIRCERASLRTWADHLSTMLKNRRNADSLRNGLQVQAVPRARCHRLGWSVSPVTQRLHESESRDEIARSPITFDFDRTSPPFHAKQRWDSYFSSSSITPLQSGGGSPIDRILSK